MKRNSTLSKNMRTSILEIFENNKFTKIAAPMVRYSKLQFRTLVRNYGCDICYTPMIMADSFCKSEQARLNEFTTNSYDTPLVVQFGVNTVHDFVGATYMVEPYSDGVEINCGCPQRWAVTSGYGCSLLSKPELIADLIRQCRSYVRNDYTISAKIRLLSDYGKTIELCRQIEKAGASYITVHGRTQHQRSSEPIDVESIKNIKQTLQIPVVANGDVKTYQDAVNLHLSTGCEGIMAARGLLTNPTIFMDSNPEHTSTECVQKWLTICYNTILNECNEQKVDLDLIKDVFCDKKLPNLTFQCFHHHLVFMLEKVLPKCERKIFNSLNSFYDVFNFLYEKYSILPHPYDSDTYRFHQITSANYDNRDEVYLKLLNKSNFSD